MFNSKPFDFQKAGDSDLCTRGLSQTNYKKLDLDDFNLGAYKGSINFWFRDLELNIKKDIIKIHKNNRFSNFQVLPWIWQPCFNFDSPENSTHFGIPNSPTEFKEFKDLGFYKNTIVEHIVITKTRSRTKSKAKADEDDTSGFELVDAQRLIFPEGEYKLSSSLTDDPRSAKDLARDFCKFFSGVEPERLPFKESEKRVWTGLFETEILSEIRDAIKVTVVIIFAVIPSLYEGSFKQNRIRNYEAFKDLIRKFLKVADPKQDPFILMSAMKVLSSPACRIFNVESKMITYRDLCLEHFHGSQFDGKDQELGENISDIYPVANTKPNYDAMHNLLALEMILSAESPEKVAGWKEDIALRKRIKTQEVDMFVLLAEKEFLYEKINASNNAKLHLDRGMIIFAHEKSNSDVVKGVNVDNFILIR